MLFAPCSVCATNWLYLTFSSCSNIVNARKVSAFVASVNPGGSACARQKYRNTYR